MRIIEVLRALRLFEISVKTGFILIGAIYAKAGITLSDVPNFIELFVISMISGLGIYAVNAYYGYEMDEKNNRLSNLYFISRKNFGRIAIISILIVLIWMLLKSIALFLITTGVFFLWTIYVHPLLNLKGRFLGGVLIAFLAQILHFHIGVFYLGQFSVELLMISIFYAMVFATGHIWHELIDWDADREAGNQTTAIVIGKYNSTWLAQLLFLLSTIYWFSLSYFEEMPIDWVIPYLIAFVIQRIYFRMKNIRKDQDVDLILNYRKVYMLTYFIATFIIFLMMQ